MVPQKVVERGLQSDLDSGSVLVRPLREPSWQEKRWIQVPLSLSLVQK
jgi:hypothetical protein